MDEGTDIDPIIKEVNEQIRKRIFTNSNQVRAYVIKNYLNEWKSSARLRYFVNAM